MKKQIQKYFFLFYFLEAPINFALFTIWCVDGYMPFYPYLSVLLGIIYIIFSAIKLADYKKDENSNWLDYLLIKGLGLLFIIIGIVLHFLILDGVFFPPCCALCP